MKGILPRHQKKKKMILGSRLTLEFREQQSRMDKEKVAFWNIKLRDYTMHVIMVIRVLESCGRI